MTMAKRGGKPKAKTSVSYFTLEDVKRLHKSNRASKIKWKEKGVEIFICQFYKEAGTDLMIQCEVCVIVGHA